MASSSENPMLSERAASKRKSMFSARVDGAYEMIVAAESDSRHINLSHGDPYFPPPAHLRRRFLRIVKNAIFDDELSALESPRFLHGHERRLHLHRYRFMPPIHPALLAVAHRHFLSKGIPLSPYGLRGEACEVTVGIGTTQLCSAALYALADPGDVVLTPNPCYGLFSRIARISGTQLRFVDPDPSNDHKMTGRTLRKALDRHPRTRCLLISNPNNPTGSVYGRAELLKIATLLRQPRYSRVSVLVDEIYEKTLLNNGSIFSFASVRGMFKRTVTLTGISKNLGLAKERIGLACGPKPLIQAMTEYIVTESGGISDSAQIIAASALGETSARYFERSNRFYMRNLALLNELINEFNLWASSRMGPGLGRDPIRIINQPESGFFICLQMNFLRGASLRGGGQVRDDFAVFSWLLEEARLTCVPGSTLGFASTDLVVRMTFSAPPRALRQAFRNIRVAAEQRLSGRPSQAYPSRRPALGPITLARVQRP